MAQQSELTLELNLSPRSTGTENYLSDWLVPYRYNFWLRLGVLLFVAGWAQIFVPPYFTTFIGQQALRQLGWTGASSVVCGFLLFLSTQGGRETTKAFRQIRRQISNRVNKARKLPTMDAILSVHNTYCAKAGVKAAAVKGKVAHELPTGFPSPFALSSRRPRKYKKWLGRKGSLSLRGHFTGPEGRRDQD